MEKESEKWIRNKEEMPTFAPSTIIKLNTDMKRIVFLIAALVIAGASSLRVQAQHDYGYFNSLGVGLSVSTTGIGVDVATPIGNYLALRAGVSFMPNISFDTDVDVDITSNGQTFDREMNVGGELGRATGEVLVNVYPFRSLGLFACVGASFGGNTLVKINGHSDELAQDIATGQSAGIEIGVTALSERAKDLRQAPLSQMAVVIGSEGQGVRKEILEAAQRELIIPMNPRCESLNAAVAATIVMWQMKQ